MSFKQSDIKQECEQILIEFGNELANWKYLKSKKSYVQQVSKNCHIELSTGFSSKVDFVNFQFGLRINHKIMKQVGELRGMPKPYLDMLLFWYRGNWIPSEFNGGRITVYDHTRSDLHEMEVWRKEGNKNYVRSIDFRDYLERVFELAEAEIARLFDITSEENLIQSILTQPVGVFPSEQILTIRLLMGDRTIFDKLLSYYEVPYEDRPVKTGSPFNKAGAEEIMRIFDSGNFPKFDFA